MIVNRAELADVMGVSKPTIDAWIDDGLPYEQRGAKGVLWQFDTGKVIRWYAEVKHRARDGRANNGRAVKADPFADPGDMPETEEEAKARKERALADLREIEVAEKCEKLVPIDEVKAIVLDEHSRVRSRLLAIPNAVRPIALTHLNNDRPASEKLVSAVEEAITDALTEVSTYLGDGVEENDD